MRRSKTGPGVRLFAAILILSILNGCAVPPAYRPTRSASITASVTAAAPPRPSHTATPPAAAPTRKIEPSPVEPLSAQAILWVSPALPSGFRDQLTLPAQIHSSSRPNSASLRLEIASAAETRPPPAAFWIYAVVAPFPTIPDQVSQQELKAAWSGQPVEAAGNKPLLMSAETAQAFEHWWGRPGAESVRVVDSQALLRTAWQEMPALAILPFEEIEPRWKVLRVDGQSPLDRAFSPETYSLSLPIRLDGSSAALEALPSLDLPANRHPQQLTVLVMTGVTALTRNLALEMEKQGVLYPLEEIGPWLNEADLTHFSNEVSFHSSCPAPARGRGNQRFCSSPRYIELLEAAGADVIELTGNHILDWGPGPMLQSLEIYRQRGWATYGGGANLKEAQQPKLVEHNGNRLAFLGCNRAGPETVWAADNFPGAAPCDLDRLEEKVRGLASAGILPIVTFQAFETEGYAPSVAQGMPDFRRMAQAGAVIVSGSQSHYPQTMTFAGKNFVHFGLGNLFFDQVNLLAYRQAFIDRHIFYNGKYLGVELLTTLAEELGRPRPMTAGEREKLLHTIFELSAWPTP